ncbi:hypothetical protein, partial [Paracoccus ravus]|uniref:hypothetical protein n=1 Tax=Paracoccus ravus TaxID=2447760 RepID=UPI001430DA7E
LTKHSHDLRFRETALSHSNLLSSRYEKILLMQPLNHGEDYHPIVGYSRQWIIALDRWIEASHLPEGGNFDLPVHIETDNIMQDMEDRMRETSISTAAGFAAFCAYVHRDQHFEDKTIDQPEMQKWQWAKIKEWAAARALSGGQA